MKKNLLYKQPNCQGTAPPLNNSAFVGKPFCRWVLLFTGLFLGFYELGAQALNDGPIEIIVRVREINVNTTPTDVAFFGIVGQPDDYTFKLWARDKDDVDGVGWQGGACLTHSFDPPGNSIDFNHSIHQFTYTTASVPRYLDLRLDAWEDESPDQLLGIGCGGTRCNFETGFCCGGFLFGLCLGAYTDDQNRCNADPFLESLDYRLGNPCQWYDHGFLTGSCPFNNIYKPRIETFWRYTKGTALNDPIDLGTLTAGALTAPLNSNECYTDTYAPSAGKDVIYTFNVAQDIKLDLSLCTGTAFDTKLFLLNSSAAVIAGNDDFCGTQSAIQEVVLAPGQYTVVVSGNNTADEGLFNLQFNACLLPSATLTATQSGGCGTALVNLSVPSAGVGASYNWSGNGVVNSNNNTTTASPNSGGSQTYAVTVTTLLGCSRTGTATLSVGTCIEGTILWKQDNVSGVKDVNVALTGDQTGNVATPLNGKYLFSLSDGNNFTITPTKNINKFNGLNAYDVFRLQQHLSGNLLTDPYQLVAADVNANNVISALDANIIQLALLGNPNALSQFPKSWRFVPTTHVMGNPPWGFPEKIVLSGAGSGLNGQNFYGIKVGDVAAAFASPANTSGDPLLLQTQDQLLIAGQEYLLEFVADPFDNLVAFQFALRFDPKKLRMEVVTPLSALPLSTENFGLQDASNGLIRVLWAGTHPLRLETTNPIFRIAFTALESGGKLSEALGLDNSSLPPYAYASANTESNLVLRFTELTDTKNPATKQDRLILHQNRPNPFQQETIIGYELPAAAQTTLAVFDLNGQLLYQQNANAQKGYNQFSINDKALPGSGLLYYRVVTATASATRKMVKVE